MPDFSQIIDGLPGGGPTFAAAAVFVFFIAVGLAYIVFRLLRKSIRMAIRLAVVAAILIIALVGGTSLWWFNSGKSPSSKPRPAPTKKR